MAGKRLEYTPDPNKFDLRTHHWNGQGHLEKKNLYTCYVIEGNAYYERPVGSGNVWLENNQPGGRVSMVNGSPRIDRDATHIAFKPKLEGDDALFYALEQERMRSAELEAELKAIRSERTTSPAVPAEAAKIEAAAKPEAAAQKAPTLSKRSAP